MSAPTRAFAAFALASALALTGCQAVRQGAADILASTGKVSQEDAEAIVKTAEILRSTFADITGEEEYYIGRATAALILSKYRPLRNAALNAYVNTMGTAIAYASDRPETYAGYHFLVLDTDEVNARAAPGGFIFVTKGLVKRCRDEETLAAILAHEVGHVAGRHGLQSIKKSRLIDAFKVIGQQAAERYGPEQLSRLTAIFEGALGDVVDTLILRGYDRKYEYEADDLGVKYAVAAGFAPQGLPDFLKILVGAGAAEQGKGWFKTHPSAADRLERANSAVASAGAAAKVLAARTQRFQQNIKGV